MIPKTSTMERSSSPARASISDVDGAVGIILDPDLLLCPVCSAPFSLPIYQCRNGRAACSSCFKKHMKHCTWCEHESSHIRCTTLEKIVESVRLPCSYSDEGCNEWLQPAAKAAHEAECPCGPCSCPATACDFAGSARELNRHFDREHPGSAVPFHYGASFWVPLAMAKPEATKLLWGEDGALFALVKQAQLVALFCLRPESCEREVSYRAVTSVAKDGGERYLTTRGPVGSVRRVRRVARDDHALQVPCSMWGDGEGKAVDLRILIDREDCLP